MRKSIVLAFSLIALTINISACAKTEKEKEVERLNEIGRQGNAAFAKLLGPEKQSTTDSKKTTKPTDSQKK